MMPSWPQLLILLAVVLLVFGTKRVRSLGSDLGGAIREFRKGVSDDSDTPKSEADKSGSASTDDTKPAKD